ncbi:MAG: DUF2971 domain-containing protein [Acidobacteriia bacterium]|nr:DUF2971 domain-containing protein [Terriglobia bacterium]
MIRVYHFLSAEHAVDNIRRRRIKIATFDTLNDPFELWAVAQPDKNVRAGLRKWKKTMSRRYGVLCFCRSWHSTLLWSHYADKHRGMALGFDVRDDLIRQMDYVKHRPMFTKVSDAMAEKLLFTKFADWQYEQEWRICTRLEDRDPETRLFFADFNKDLVLREVIAGPLCETSKVTIERALRKHDRVSVVKGRLAFKSFRVIKNNRGFR